MATASSKLLTLFPIIFLLLSTLSQSSASSSPDSITGKDPSVSWYRSMLALRRNDKNQIPNCGKMVSRSQCLQNPKCRWCRSEAVDDMCFSKAEAWRLPQQNICSRVKTMKQMHGQKVQCLTCFDDIWEENLAS